MDCHNGKKNKFQSCIAPLKQSAVKSNTHLGHSRLAIVKRHSQTSKCITEYTCIDFVAH